MAASHLGGAHGAFTVACGIFSLWRAGFFLAVVLGLQSSRARGFSCSAACGILVPPPGIEPASPALEGRFLTTGPPGKSPQNFFKEPKPILRARWEKKVNPKKLEYK